MELPTIQDLIIIHYGCADFNSLEHVIYWIGAVSHKPSKSYFFENNNEIEIIEKFQTFINENRDNTFIHWSMNTPKFGFLAIQNRYYALTSKKINLDPINEIDLSEFLKNKYGVNYIERENGRLDNLARLNKFSGIKSNIEVININDATNRLELIYSIVQAEKQGCLKTLQPQQPQAVNSDEVLKNPDENIFKDGFAFALFDKMKGLYSDTNTAQADYSFLFDIMQKKGFVICTGIKFIDFLKDFDISITKIDSSKTGNKRKTKLYNAIVENLQKKHGLSTV